MASKLFAHLRRQWIGVLALLLVLTGGTAIALDGHNTVFSDDIVNGQVKPADLAKPPKPTSAGLTKNESFNCANAPNQWASSRPSVNGVVSYYRDSGGVVHLSGHAARCGTPPTGETIFVLPPGYRPPAFRDEAAVNNGVFIELTIDKQGDVVPPTAGDGAIVSLDGITFRCGPSGKNGCP